MGLELRECHLDRVEVGAVRRQKEEPCPSGTDGNRCPLAFVAVEIVHDDDVAWREGWHELGFDIGFEDGPVRSSGPARANPPASARPGATDAPPGA